MKPSITKTRTQLRAYIATTRYKQKDIAEQIGAPVYYFDISRLLSGHKIRKDKVKAISSFLEKKIPAKQQNGHSLLVMKLTQEDSTAKYLVINPRTKTVIEAIQ